MPVPDAPALAPDTPAPDAPMPVDQLCKKCRLRAKSEEGDEPEKVMEVEEEKKEVISALFDQVPDFANRSGGGGGGGGGIREAPARAARGPESR